MWPFSRPASPIQISMPYNVTARASQGEAVDHFIEHTRAFSNRLPDALDNEKAEAHQQGINRILAATQEFDAILSSHNPFKWVYTVYGQLWIVPQDIGGRRVLCGRRWTKCVFSR